MQDLRKGLFDVLIGVNLLREGLDLPEVSLVAILDADKEGFLRSHRSLTQTVGRAARNAVSYTHLDVYKRQHTRLTNNQVRNHNKIKDVALSKFDF